VSRLWTVPSAVGIPHKEKHGADGLRVPRNPDWQALMSERAVCLNGKPGDEHRLR